MIIDGKTVANKLLDTIKRDIQKADITPKFISILVGDDEASKIYLRQKRLKCEYTGIGFELIILSENITTNELIKEIQKINNDKTIHGCLVQLPLPEHINKDKILDSIDPLKDVDCFHSSNIGKLITGNPSFFPATAFGIIKLIEEYNKNVIKQC